MLDIKFIRENEVDVRRACRVKDVSCDLDRLLEVDTRRRAIQQEADALRSQSRELSGQIGLYKNPKSQWFQKALAEGRSESELRAEGDRLQAESAAIRDRIKTLEEEAKTNAEAFRALMLTVPQVPSERTPVGEDESGNVEVRRVGEGRSFEFEPKDHVAVGQALGIIDIDRGVKLAGARNYLLRGAGTMLHQAVLRLAMDTIAAR